MKKFFVFMTIVLSFGSLKAQSPNTDLSDTVWTKNIWPENVVGVMFSPSGNEVYVSTDTRVWIINTLTGDSIKTIKEVGAFKVMSSDNKYIYTSLLYKIDASTFQVLDSLKNRKYSYQLHDLAISLDNKSLLAVGHIWTLNNQNYNLWKINTETMTVEEYKDYSGGMNNVSLSPDGKYFVTDWNNGIYNTKDLTRKLLLWDAKTFTVIKEIYSDTSFFGFMKFSQDNKYFCVNIKGILKFYETINFTKFNSFDDIVLGQYGTFDITNDSKYSIASNKEYISVSDINKKFKGIIYNYPYTGEIIKLSPNQKYFMASNMGLVLFNMKTQLFDKVEKNVEKLNFLSVNPNPTNHNISINFKNIKNGNYNLTIYDEMGKEVSKIYSGYLEVGESSYNINIQSFLNGVYFCKVIGNNVNLVQKFIVSK